MKKLNKQSKKEMTLGEACRAILKEGRDAIFDIICSIGKKPK